VTSCKTDNSSLKRAKQTRIEISATVERVRTRTADVRVFSVILITTTLSNFLFGSVMYTYMSSAVASTFSSHMSLIKSARRSSVVTLVFALGGPEDGG
jgi:fructose-specific phosphotransferase system IIC component